MPAKLPPHVYRELVNELREIAKSYGQTQQLRERLNDCLSRYVIPDHDKKKG